MLSFVVTTVTTIFVSRIGFYLSARLGLLFLFMDSKNSLYGSLARVLLRKLLILHLSVFLVMAEIGRNCAVSEFCCLGMDWYWTGDE